MKEKPPRKSIMPEDVLRTINDNLGGYDTQTGLRFVSATDEEVVAELEITANHLQPFGLVHGGVLAAMVESLCSFAAVVTVMPEGKTAVGLENSTSFLRAARSGTLRGRARPLSIGRRTHVCSAEISDQEGRPVASGKVRLMILDSGSHAGGEKVRLNHPPAAS